MSRGQEATARRDFGHVYQRGDTYWIRYSVGGRRYWESTHSTNEREAEKLLTRRQVELGLGAFTSPDVKRTTFEDLAQIIRDEYVVNGRRSDRLECSLKHLTAAFGGARAATITLDRLTGYVRQRLEAKAAPGTVWNELKALRRAFRLAKRAGRVAHEPEFPELAGVDRVRTGFFEEADYRAVLAELSAPLQSMIEFAYHTGWRIPSEVARMTWAQVDFHAGVVRLEVGSTKNDDGRTFPFSALPQLEALLKRQHAATKVVERELGCIIPWVFHRRGKRIRYFDKAWKSALERAAVIEQNGVEVVTRPQLFGRVPHDFRRTAVRNLERAGVSRSVATKLTGHKTEAVYRRYAIVAEQDLREGVAKLANVARGETKGGQSGVLPLEKPAATGTA